MRFCFVKCIGLVKILGILLLRAVFGGPFWKNIRKELVFMPVLRGFSSFKSFLLFIPQKSLFLRESLNNLSVIFHRRLNFAIFCTFSAFSGRLPLYMLTFSREPLQEWTKQRVLVTFVGIFWRFWVFWNRWILSFSCLCILNLNFFIENFLKAVKNSWLIY